MVAYCLTFNPLGRDIVAGWPARTYREPFFSFCYSCSFSRFYRASRASHSFERQRRMLGFRQRTPSAGEKKKGSDAPPLEPPWGNPLRRHHMQTIIICSWVLCIIAYIGAIEKAIAEHSQPTSDRPGSMGVGGSFGGRGTRRRQEAVQILSFARTILTAVHVCSELDDPISRPRIIS